MSELHALPRLDSRRTWLWLAVGLIAMSALLASFAPRRQGRVGPIGAGGPTVRPQSETRPMLPPSVARMRALAA